MSTIRTIFDDIKSKLVQVKNEHGEKVFKTIDLNRGQMQQIKGFENTGQIIIFPAVFFKPEDIKNYPRPNNIYLVEMRIRFHVVTNNLVHADPLEIFDLPMILDQSILDQKWESVSLASIHKGFEVMPEVYDNNQVYEVNYWVKFWNTNAFQYRDFIDANDVAINPSAPVELDLCGIISGAEDEIRLSDNSIDENTDSGYTIGTISTTNNGDYLGDYTYSLGENSENQDKVEVVGDLLRSTAIFDHETISSFNITIKCTNDQDESIESDFIIFVNDVNEVPMGTECGIGVANYKDVQEGDKIEVFDRIEIKRTLD